MANEETKHRTFLALYDLQPQIEECYIAPNATVIGEVRV
jgi:carbonic anhydrase/acetyltransferase-like protein (isoleucine patch superfamily)